MVLRIVQFGVLAGLGCLMAVVPDARGVLGGIALFLYGLLLLDQGFGELAGGALEKLLGAATASVPRALAFGLITTTLLQSSSLVSVITLSFVSAGLVPLRQGIAVVFGANLGTTTGAWLMAGFGLDPDLSVAALPMLIGGLVLMLPRQRPTASIGRLIAGVGFVLLGLQYMKDGFGDAQSSLELSRWSMDGVAGLLVYTGVGAVVTVLMQSSHATLMLAITALDASQLTYVNALAIAIGANIGTTGTALLAAIGSGVDGRRLAGAHLVFKLVTGVVALAAIAPLRAAVEVIAGTVGIAEDDTTLHLALFHTLFNVIGLALCVPALSPLVRLLQRVLPASDDEEAERALYLNRAAARRPGAALEALRRETQHLLDNGFRILAHAIGVHREDVLSDRALEELARRERRPIDPDVLDGYYLRIKHVYNDIVDFASETSDIMDRAQRAETRDLLVACRDVARAVKVMAHVLPNLEDLGREDGAIGEQYDALRVQLAQLLRRIYRIKVADDIALRARGLQLARADVHSSDVLVNGTIDALVRDDAITSTMATSLMNDSALAHDIAEALLDAAARMYVAHHPQLDTLDDDVRRAALDGDALDEVEPVRDLGEQRITSEYRRIVQTGRSDDSTSGV